MKRQTTYDKAVNFLGSNYILCNDIVYIDECLDLRFDLDIENGEEIYQYYLSDCSEADVEFLEKAFDLKFAYSEKLGLYVLCVNHWGTSWESVPCECMDDDIPDKRL